MGRIKPSPESIDMNMEVGEGLIKRAKAKLITIVMEDLYYAALNPSQAALMLYGIAPPTPKETVRLLEEIFVKKEKLLEQKYVDILEELRIIFKKIEHRKLKVISGKEVDELVIKAETYLKRIKKLFTQINRKKEKYSINKIHKNSLEIVKDVLVGVKYKNIEIAFKKYCDKNKLPDTLPTIFKNIIKAKKEFQEKKLTKAELDRVKRKSSTLMRVLTEHIQRLKRDGLEKCTIKFKYGKEIGDLILLENKAFILTKQEIQKAELKKGSLVNIQKAAPEELEKEIIKIKPPKELILKTKTLESLKKLFGDVEILMNY